LHCMELEEINPLHNVKISGEIVAQLQKATEQDPMMQVLKRTMTLPYYCNWMASYPRRCTPTKPPLPIRDYWKFREKLTLHNGILFKSEMIIIIS